MERSGRVGLEVIKIEIYKINDVYKNGVKTGAIYSNCNDAEWLDTPDMMAKVTKDKIELYYGHKSYSSADNPIIFAKNELKDFIKLIGVWKKRRMKYARWDGYGAMYKGQIGWIYSKPFSKEEKDYKIEEIKVKRKKILKKEILEGFNKAGEEYTNEELTSEFIEWNGFKIELQRSEIGVRKATRGFILPDYELAVFDALTKLIK